MSAAVAWDAGPAPRPAQRPRLVLVPTGDQVRAASFRGRLTPRGRLVLSVLVLVLVTTVVVGSAAAFGSGGGADHMVTVRAGQTLSEIAATELPKLPIREGVAEIEIANELNNAEVNAGQTLKIPRL